MFSRRDLWIAACALGVGATLGHVATAAKPPVQQSALWDWTALTASPTGVGQYRQIFRGPTLTLDELELHATTLNPGQSSHPPHKHPNEELVILASGTLEATSNGKVQRLGPGSVIFNASNELHSVRNVGDVPATYTVVNWTSPLTPREAAAKAPAAPSSSAAPSAAAPSPAAPSPAAPAKP